MSRVILKLEGIVGHEVQDIIRDGLLVAHKLGCLVEIPCNGVTVLIGPNDDPEALGRAYEAELNSSHTYKYASTARKAR